MEKRWYFKKEKGKIIWFFPKLEDWEYKITVAKHNRSLAQNRLYWGYFLKQICLYYKEIWIKISIDDLHFEFKKRLPRKRIYSDFTSKKYIVISWSTSDLTTSQFTSYIESINEELMDRYQWSVELDITEDDLIYWESIIL